MNKNKRNHWFFWIILLLILLFGCLGIFGFMKASDRDIRKFEQAVLDEPASEENEGAESGTMPEISIQTGKNEAQLEEKDAEQTLENQAEENQAIELVFAGDVLLSDHVLAAYERGGGISGVVGPGFLEEIRQADIFMVNQEFPFSVRGEQAPDKQYTFRLPPEKVSLFQEMGIDIVTLANNHALDFGRDALLDTCKTLDDASILRVGAGTMEEAERWQTIEAGGKKIGFLGATRVIPVSDWAVTACNPGMLATYDPTRLLEKIKEAKLVNDYVVVYVHWGVEREEFPKDYQRTLGRQYIDAGADLVVGSHPHVLQGIEYYQGKPIVYSLGNFVFGSSIPKTMLLKVRLEGEQAELSVIPGTSSAGYTRELTEEGKKQEFYQYLEGISDIAIDEQGTICSPKE